MVAHKFFDERKTYFDIASLCDISSTSDNFYELLNSQKI